MGSLDLSIVNVAFPALEHAFSHDSRATLSWVLTGYAIVFGSLLVVAGRTADRLGSRRVFFFGLGVFCLGSLLCGIAPSVETLILGRIVQGTGAAAMLPASLGLLLAAYSKERRSQVVALWGGIGALAVATGPSLGALLITGFGWRAAFYVNLPVGLVAWLVGRRVIAKSNGSGSTSSPDYPGVILLSAALALVVLAISEGPTWGWTSARILAGFAVALVLLFSFLFRSARHEEPVLDLTLFRARSFSLGEQRSVPVLNGILCDAARQHLVSHERVALLDPARRALGHTRPIGRCGGVGNSREARGTIRLPQNPDRRLHACSPSACSGTYGASTVHPAYLADWLPGTLIVGLGIGFTFPVISAAAVSSLEPARYSVGSAVNQTARQIGGALGVAILVVILGTPTSLGAALENFRHLWIFAASTAAIAGVICAFLARPAPARCTGCARCRQGGRGRRDARRRDCDEASSVAAN